LDDDVTPADLVGDLYEQYFSSKDETMVMEAGKNRSDAAATTTRHGSDRFEGRGWQGEAAGGP